MSSESSSSFKNIVCYIRCRPLNITEDESNANCVFIDQSSNSIRLRSDESKTFTFNRIFSDSLTQSDLFQSIGIPMLHSLIKGYNGTIFAYGQTGSGKTYTMIGPFESINDNGNYSLGLIPNILHYLFDDNNKSRINTSISQSFKHKPLKTSYTLSCSCLEIYQDHIIDLLFANESTVDIDTTSNTNPPLTIRKDPKKGMYIENLTEIPIDSNKEAIEALMLGLKNRHVASTHMNAQSSRSHFIFTIFLMTNIEMKDGLIITRTSRLHLVDLAGSERQKSTESFGDRIKEAGVINKSLSTLGNVINAVIEANEGKTKHIPYRDSKLTHYLKDSIGGNSNTIIIGNISQSYIHLQESLSTLAFVQRAKMIKNKAIIVNNTNDTIKYLQFEIKKLNKRIGELTDMNVELQQKLNKTKHDNDNIHIICKNDKEKRSMNQLKMQNSNDDKFEDIIMQIDQLLSFEDKFKTNLQDLELSYIGALEKFNTQKDIYENQYQSIIKTLLQKKESKEDLLPDNNPSIDVICLSDKIKIFDLISQSKLYEEEAAVYINIIHQFKNKALIENNIHQMLKEYISISNDLKAFLSKQFQADSNDNSLDKASLLNLFENQIEESKIREEHLMQTIESLQSENFLLSMEANNSKPIPTMSTISSIQDENGNGNGNGNNIKQSLIRKNSINKDNSSNSVIVDELQNEIENLILEKHMILLDKIKIEKLINDNELNEIIKELNDNNERVNQLYFAFDCFLQLVKDKEKERERHKVRKSSNGKELTRLVNAIFAIFKSKETKRNIESAIDLMINVQETLELHRYYIEAKSKTRCLNE